MIFNSDKFECLCFWPRHTKPDFTYKSPDGSVIEEKDHLRDLGVEMSNDLTFNIHIANTVAAANKLVGWALRTFRRRSKHVMLTIWKSLIQSKLDYCSQLWSPSDQASIGKLESVLPPRYMVWMDLRILDHYDHRSICLEMFPTKIQIVSKLSTATLSRFSRRMEAQN